MPKVSVVMSVYNDEKYLKESMDSILSQTFDDFEFIIVNDGSSDKTEEIIKSYNDSRIVYVANIQNLGLPASLNKGIRLANGEYIARMDGDDISFPERFVKQVKFLDINRDYGVVGCWIHSFGRVDHITKYSNNFSDIFYAFIKNDATLCHPAAMIRKSILLDYNIFYCESFSSAQDFKLWNDIKHVSKISNIQEVLLKYRTHYGSITSSKSIEQKNFRGIVVSDEFRKVFGRDFMNDYFKIINNDFKNVNQSVLKRFLESIISYRNRSFKILLIKRFLRSKMRSKKDSYRLLKNIRLYMLISILRG